MYNGHGFIYMIIAQILFFIITMVLIIWVIKSSKIENNKNSVELLNAKLAKGDITKK